MLSNPSTTAKRKMRFERVLIRSDNRSIPSSLPKRRKTVPTHPQVISIDSPNLSPTTSPQYPPTLDLVIQSNKLIWVDLALDSNQHYWWPALVYESGPKTYVSLIPDPKSELIDCNPKLLSSFKGTRQFHAHSNFQPTELNPILEDENLRSKFPSLQSLQEAYVIAREKHVIYSFQEDDDLPDLSACMIPLSQESRALLDGVLSQGHQRPQSSPDVSIEREFELSDSYEQAKHQSSDESSIDELDLAFDQPDLELDIPGEAVLSRTNPKYKHYWPARILSYAGLKTRKRRFKNSNKENPKVRREKLYELEFFDGHIQIVPRSRFWTADQDEFHNVEVGRVKTKEVDFEEVIPQINDQLDQLDSVISGKSGEKEIVERHEIFFINHSSAKGNREIPQDVKYAKYGEELIHKMGQVLIQRYLSERSESEAESEHKIQVDERFKNLTESEKSRYVYDILVPHLIWLITVRQYMEDAEKELMADECPKDLTESKRDDDDNDNGGNDGTVETTDNKPKVRDEEILRRAKEIASIVIQRVDIVDQITSLRVRKSSYAHDFDQPRTKQRQTKNSRKTLPSPPA